MPLNPTQLEFLQKHVLRRRMMPALDLAGAATPSAAELVAERRVTAQSLQAMLGTLLNPPRATPDEAARINTMRETITRTLSGYLSYADIDEAGTQLRTLDAEIQDCERRITEHDEATRQRKARIVSDQDLTLKALVAGTLPPDLPAITQHGQRITALVVADLPGADELTQAEVALLLLKKAVADANQHLAEDRQRRSTAKQALLSQLDAAKLSDEATVEEAKQGLALSGKLTSLLAAEFPADEALDQAAEPLAGFKAFTAKTNEDIAKVRKPRFARAGEVAQQLADLSTELPPECPEPAKTELQQAHATLGIDIQPFLEWAQVTAWEPAALDALALRITTLDEKFNALRKQLADALEAIRLAAEAANLAITSPKSNAFSAHQRGHFEAALKLAVGGAEAALLAVAPHVEKIKALGRQVDAVSRLRNDLLRRLGLLPAQAPAAASAAEQKRWTDLRAVAARATDEVTEA